MRTYSKAIIFGAVIFLTVIFISEKGITEKRIDDWDFLSTTTIGARQFLQAHPQFDGRGVVIFILDTGVDMAAPGLTQTSTGQVKVIDVRDFSRQGDIALYLGQPGTNDAEKYIQHPDGFRLYNYHLLTDQACDSTYFIGYLDEKRFQNSDVNDINSNGRLDDRFGILAFQIEEHDSLQWVAFVDTDGDQHLDDEKRIQNYHRHYDTFQLRGGDKNFDRRPLTFALNMDPDERLVSLHFDDSGHGTHVAGIAAGYQIHRQQGFNGIAPGAQIISLKIGNGTYENGCTVSGSMRQAFDFVRDYARVHRQPVIINLSYGLGSIREGQSEIDRMANDLVTYNANIFLCVSAGNDGPGLSTVGSPAAAPRAFTVGALLPRDIANNYYGARLTSDKIFYFSARGGELNKPDALAPAAASSTVPNFTDDDFMRGTSMAAPQVAGAAALLLSAAANSTPSVAVTNRILHKALTYSATPLQGYSPIDQGHGVINVPAAFKLLQQLSARGNNDPVDDYEITTESPTAADNFNATAYWRTGGYFPTGEEHQTFSVRPIFSDSLNADARANFYRAYTLVSSQPWLIPKNKSIYIKGENAASIDVEYDPRLLQQPGLYCGKIIAYRRSTNGTSTNPVVAEFELLNTIIIPYVFDHQNRYQQEFRNRALAAADVHRYFILVPVSATEAKIRIAPGPSHFCDVTAFIYNPYGESYGSPITIASKGQNTETQIISQPDLLPGIWEIDIYADLETQSESSYQLDINFSSFRVTPAIISDFDYQLGESPQGTFEVINQFNRPFFGFGRGKLLGYQRSQKKFVADTDKFSYDFSIEPDIKMVQLALDIDDESFLQFTDVAITITDARGNAVLKEAMTQNKIQLTLDRLSSNSYTLEIVAAFASTPIDEVWEFNLTEKYFIKEPIDIKIYQNHNRLFKFYPFVTRPLNFTLDRSPRFPPDGFRLFGNIEFIDRHLIQQVFSVPVEFKK
ncbi:MAG: S8 family serine peptidase [candidate division KSB1 bacterium]|nr:S8 family serine peptidase [candidate division KSB1 bacterium]